MQHFKGAGRRVESGCGMGVKAVRATTDFRLRSVDGWPQTSAQDPDHVVVIVGANEKVFILWQARKAGLIRRTGLMPRAIPRSTALAITCRMRASVQS